MKLSPINNSTNFQARIKIKKDGIAGICFLSNAIYSAASMAQAYIGHAFHDVDLGSINNINSVNQYLQEGEMIRQFDLEENADEAQKLISLHNSVNLSILAESAYGSFLLNEASKTIYSGFRENSKNNSEIKIPSDKNN